MGTKPDKNGSVAKPGKVKSSYSRERKTEENAKRRAKSAKSYKLYKRKKKERAKFAITSKYKERDYFCQGFKVVNLQGLGVTRKRRNEACLKGWETEERGCLHAQTAATKAPTRDIQERSQTVRIVEAGIGSQDPTRRNQIGRRKTCPSRGFAVTKTERWVMPTWCHMIDSTLTGNARVWFDDLSPESIDSYDDLKKAFLENYLQQKKCIKDPIEIHNIKQRDGKSMEDFVKRYKLESRDVKGASECMRISRFVHGITNPELIKRLHEKILKTVDKIMRVTTSFLRGNWQPRIMNGRSRFHHRNNNKKLPICYDDDDDEERSNSLQDNIIFRLPPYVAITPTEPVDSLSMGDEHLDTIPVTKSDEFIKSSVKNLVPNSSESEGDNECDVPAGFTTFSNVLFDVEYDFNSSDDQSFSDEYLPEKIYSNPLFDEEVIPMKIDPHSFNIDSLFDEFTGELTLLKSIPPGIDETDCYPEKETRFTKRLLYDNSSPRLPKEIISDNSNADIESFSPYPIPNEDSDSHMEEIDLPFTSDDPMPSGIEEDDYDSERDILILKELLDNYSLSLYENESYHFDIPSSHRPPAKPPDGNMRTLNIKMMGDIFEQKVPISGLTITRVSNQEKPPDLLSHQGLKIFQPSAECPIMINRKNTHVLDVPLFYFYPP
nr:reverse transcriptase domain-containing protein [Tanacetum cinerariifolium]